MLSATGSPLVAGTAALPMATKTIKVLRSFYFEGKVQETGKVIEVPAAFAAEMQHCHKAEPFVQPPQIAEPEPEKTPAPVKRGRK